MAITNIMNRFIAATAKGWMMFEEKKDRLARDGLWNTISGK
jgi:hypothetical protein